MNVELLQIPRLFSKWAYLTAKHNLLDPIPKMTIGLSLLFFVIKSRNIIVNYKT